MALTKSDIRSLRRFNTALWNAAPNMRQDMATDETITLTLSSLDWHALYRVIEELTERE